MLTTSLSHTEVMTAQVSSFGASQMVSFYVGRHCPRGTASSRCRSLVCHTISMFFKDPSFAPGQPLELVPEPDNPHDPNAIAVWNAGRSLHVGYLPREYAAKLAKDLGGGPKIACMAIWETRKGKQRVALRALMVEEHAKMRGVGFA